MIAQIQIRRGTTAEWAAASPVVLASGEPGYDTTIKSMKIGDGVTEWASLPFGVACPYDIGDVLQTMNATSPATRWVGTSWAAVGAGTFLVAAGAGYAAGSTGGAKTHTNPLSNAGYAKIMGVNGDNNLHIDKVDSASWTSDTGFATGAWTTSGGSFTNGTGLGGSTDSASSEPPYYAVYMWRRTA